MSKAILGTFVDVRSIKTRSVLQIVVEIPIEKADEAMKFLGGFPQPAEERWVGIALAKQEREKIEAPAEHKDRKPFHTLPLSQQAALRCGDTAFKEFLDRKHGYSCSGLDDSYAAVAVRSICRVMSRSQFDKDGPPLDRWIALDTEFKQWLTDQQFAESVR